MLSMDFEGKRSIKLVSRQLPKLETSRNVSSNLNDGTSAC